MRFLYGMSFPDFIKGQFGALVDAYDKRFRRMLETAWFLALACWAIGEVLIHFTGEGQRRYDLVLDWFYDRTSSSMGYAAADMIKTVFLLFAALFAIMVQRDHGGSSFLKRVLSVKALEAGQLFMLLVLLTPIDIGLTRLQAICRGSENSAWLDWAWSVIFFARIYLPLLVFSWSVGRSLTGKYTRPAFRTLLFALAALWLVNEIAFEVTIFIFNCIGKLLVAPMDGTYAVHYAQMLLGSFFAALLLPAYASALVYSHIALDNSPRRDHAED
jgi:hypothetical protein